MHVDTAEFSIIKHNVPAQKFQKKKIQKKLN